MTCHGYDYKLDADTVDWLQNQRCNIQKERITAIRDTWLGICLTDYRFFYGRGMGRTLQSDEVMLPCGDKYIDNPAKMKEICVWALAHGYDYILRLDDDTFIKPSELINKTCWSMYDYSGSAEKDFHPGGCLFLSAKAMREIVSARVTHHADDLWIGRVMQSAQIKLHHIEEIQNDFGPRYNVTVETALPTAFAYHSCKPEVMRELYARTVR